MDLQLLESQVPSMAAVRAVEFCPYDSNIIATCGPEDVKVILFYLLHTFFLSAFTLSHLHCIYLAGVESEGQLRAFAREEVQFQSGRRGLGPHWVRVLLRRSGNHLGKILLNWLTKNSAVRYSPNTAFLISDLSIELYIFFYIHSY